MTIGSTLHHRNKRPTYVKHRTWMRLLCSMLMVGLVVTTIAVGPASTASAAPLPAEAFAPRQQVPEVAAGNLLTDYFQVNLQLQTVTASGVLNDPANVGANVGDTDVAAGPDNTYIFVWDSFVPQRPGGTVDWIEGDWIGQYESGNPAAPHIDVQHPPAAGTADLDYYPSGGEEFDVEAVYFDNDANYFYVAVVTSVPFVDTYIDANTGETYQALGVAAPELDFDDGGGILSTPGSLFYPGDLALDLGVGTQRQELNSAFGYDYGVDLVHEDRTTQVSFNQAGWIAADERDFNIGNQLYKTEHDAGGSDNSPSADSAWYTSVFKGFTTGGWSHTNFDPIGIPDLVEARGAVDTAYYEYTFPNGNLENDSPTYVVEFVIPRTSFQDDNPADGETVGLRWVEGCRNDGNGTEGVLTLSATVDEPPASATVSIGDQVWLDANNNGLKDIEESGIPGVAVTLWSANPDGTPNATVGAPATTNADGYFLFDDLAPGDYILQIAPDQLGAGGPLDGHVSSTGNGAAPDPDDNEDEDDDNGDEAPGLGVISAPVTLTAGGEPTADDETGISGNADDNSSNQTVDFGFFVPVALGDQVWFDENNNGLKDAGELGIEGVTLKLWTDNDGDATPDTDTGLTATTDANGYYLFDGLGPGSYFVQIPPSEFNVGGPLEGRSSSTGNGAAPDADDNPAEDDDNGDPLGTLGVVSKAITIASGQEPTDDDETGIATTTDDASSNKTLDFGFYTTPPAALSLGDQVWQDDNSNGVIDDGEAGINGVTVTLWTDVDNDNQPDAPTGDTTVTANGGYYVFTNLAPGNYIVQIAPEEFAAGKPLSGFTSSTGNDGADGAPDADALAVENDDNGDFVTGVGVISKAVTLSAGDEPTDDREDRIPAGVPTEDSNKTLDFGFYQPAPEPLALGDYVWFDVNNNGLVDDGETGITGVTLTLWTDIDGDDQPDVATGDTAITNGSGRYVFTNLAPGDYIVQIAPSEFADGKPLNGYLSSTGNGPAPDPDDDVENDDNGDDNGDPVAGLGVLSKAVTLSVGGEPTDDEENIIPGDTLNVNSNKTVDFGFFILDPNTTLSLGDQIWLDPNNNGLIDAGESGIAGVEVVLWTADAGGAPVATVGAPATTDASGYYVFNDLTPGDYIVQIPASQFAAGSPLAGLTSSTGNNVSGSAPDPDDDVEGDDNGDPAITLGVLSKAVTLQPNSEPVGEGGPPSGASSDANSNQTVDFGFFQPVSLGNRVWLDPNNNGVIDSGESGIEGVTLKLWTDDDGDGEPDASTLLTAITDQEGYYLFDNLVPGDYVVQIANTEFAAGGPLAGHTSSSGNDGADGAPDPDDDVDSDDNGEASVGLGVISKAVTLGYDSEPTGETGNLTSVGADNDSNQTVDFGFVASEHSLGNFIWFDDNNNGQRDNGEAPVVNGVVVELLTADMTTVIDTTTTDAGYYLFTGLNAGTYKVRLAAANFQAGGPLVGYTHSTGINQESMPDDDRDQNDNGVDNTIPTDDGILSGIVTLGIDEPVGETPTASGTAGDDGFGTADTNSNLTVDFGIVQVAHSIGNYVWLDSNNNGVVDTTELPVPDGVILELLDSAGNSLDRSTVTSNGFYLFGNLPAGSYIVRLASSNFTATGPLPGYTHSTGPGQEADPDSDGDQNDNGVDGSTPSGSGIASGVITLGTDEPLQETPTTNGTPGDDGLGTPDASSNLTVDFGVLAPPSTVNLGGMVWDDANNDGQFNPETEQGIAGIEVQIFPVGADPQTASPLLTQTTGPDGSYNFAPLDEGTYFVYIPTPPAAQPVSSMLTDSSDNREDNDDNGIQVSAGDPVRSPNIELKAGTEPANDGDGPNGDLTIDFGFWKPFYSLGNYVWIDTNNDGQHDVSESPVPDGVLLELLDAQGTATGETAQTENGFYLFSDLEAGDYQIRIAASNFAAGGLLEGYTHSTGAEQEANPNADGDQNDNGLDTSDVATEGITSGVVTLSDDEPTDESPTATDEPGNDGNGTQDTDSNLTVDFGVVAPADAVVNIGNLVWQDSNINGLVDVGEPGIDGIQILLFPAGADPVADLPLATQTTANGGRYEFTDLAPGVYFLYIPSPLSPFTGSSPVDNQEDSGINDDDNGLQSEFNGPVRSPDITLTPNNEPEDDGDGPNGDLTIDFGFFNTPVAVGDKVWIDANADGLFDASEVGVPNVTVTLFKADEPLVPFLSTTTFANGFYLFPAVPADNYFVQFDLSTLPDGYIPTQPNVGDDDQVDSDADQSTGITAPTGELTPGTSDLTLDLGIIPAASMGDLVWYDRNRDGIQNGTETGISGQPGQYGVPGVLVKLFTEAGEEVGSTRTNADGTYGFDGLIPGSYYVEFVPPAGYTISPPNASPDDDVFDSDAGPLTGRTAVFVLTAGQNDPTLDLGLYLTNQQPASIGNIAWFDADADGLQEVEETSLAGVLVSLYDGDGNKLAETTTDANGNYLFANLAPGDYSVGFEASEAFVPSPKNAGTSTAADSDPDPTTGRTEVITLTSGQTDLDWDAGFSLTSLPGAIGDRVWLDTNGNGLQDENLDEEGVPGITVMLYNGEGDRLAVTKTDTTGRYAFTNLPTGSYYVGFVLPNGYQASPMSVGNDITVDSDPNQQTLLTSITTITPGENDTSWDLGIVQGPGGLATSTIGNLVWEDRNENGIRDVDEPPIPGVTVKLYNEQGELYATTVTDNSGNYLFNNILPGTYYIEFVLPGDPDSGVKFSNRSTNPGTDNDSDVSGTTGRTQAIVVPEGTVDLTWDAGIVLSPTGTPGNPEEPTSLEPDVEPNPNLAPVIYLPFVNGQ